MCHSLCPLASHWQGLGLAVELLPSLIAHRVSPSHWDLHHSLHSYFDLFKCTEFIFSTWIAQNNKFLLKLYKNISFILTDCSVKYSKISGRNFRLLLIVEGTIFWNFLDFLRRKQIVELEHHSSSRLDYTISYILLVKYMNYKKLWFCQCHMFPEQEKRKDIPKNLVSGNHTAVKKWFTSLYNKKHNSLSWKAVISCMVHCVYGDEKMMTYA